jgi:hypothetical protein
MRKFAGNKQPALRNPADDCSCAAFCVVAILD